MGALLVAGDTAGCLRFAQGIGHEERRDGCISRCDLCLDLRSYLVAHRDFPELSPREFYPQAQRGSGLE